MARGRPLVAPARGVGAAAVRVPATVALAVDSGPCTDVALSLLPGGTLQAVVRPAGSVATVVPAWQLIIHCFPWGDTVTL